MGDAALPFDGLTVPRSVEGHLDLFEQPDEKQGFQQLAGLTGRQVRADRCAPPGALSGVGPRHGATAGPGRRRALSRHRIIRERMSLCKPP